MAPPRSTLAQEFGCRPAGCDRGADASPVSDTGMRSIGKMVATWAAPGRQRRALRWVPQLLRRRARAEVEDALPAVLLAGLASTAAA